MNAILYRLLAFGAFWSSLFFSVGVAWGQCPTANTDPNSVGAFTVPAKVCLGNQITVSSVPSNLTSPVYYYRYDGTTQPGDYNVDPRGPIYTYPQSGTYTILQKASRAGTQATGTIACRTVEVIQPKAIDFTAKVCSGLSTTLTYNLTAETAIYDVIDITWGDGSNDTYQTPGPKSVVHTYANTQSRTITVRGIINGTSGCQGPSSQTVVVPQNASSGVNPVINTLTSSDNAIAMRYQAPSGTTVEILRKDAGGSAFVSAGLVSPTSPFTVAAPSDKVTCFQVVAKDACGTERRSSEVCSLVLNAQAADRQNKLNWIPYSGTYASFRGYRIYRNGGAPLIGGLPSGQSAYTDAFNIQCGDRYCYRIEATLTNPPVTPDQTIVTSAESCVTGVDAGVLAGPSSVFVSVQSDGVYVKSALPQPQSTPAAVYTLVVARASQVGGPFTDLGTSNDVTYTDKTASTSTQSYCYQTAVINKCGVKSAYSKPVCSILLTVGPDGALRWNNDSPFSNETPGSYLIVRIDPNTGQPDDKFDVGRVNQYAPDPQSQVTQYQVVAVDSKGIESYSNPIDIQLAPKLFVPTAFSPNGDSQNDGFMPKGQFWNELDMTLFDRWGGVVYNTTNKEDRGWNGDVNGQPAPSGYYTYRIKIKDVNGRTYERTGRFLLIR